MLGADTGTLGVHRDRCVPEPLGRGAEEAL